MAICPLCNKRVSLFYQIIVTYDLKRTAKNLGKLFRDRFRYRFKCNRCSVELFVSNPKTLLLAYVAILVTGIGGMALLYPMFCVYNFPTAFVILYGIFLIFLVSLECLIWWNRFVKFEVAEK